MKKLIIAAIGLLSCYSTGAQTLEKMNWFNEPKEWNISGGELSMYVTPHTDYWRISHYGFTVDDAPFLYSDSRPRSESPATTKRGLTRPG